MLDGSSKKKVSEFHLLSSFKRPHYLLTQALVLILLTAVTLVSCLSINTKFYWGFFCMPMILPYMWIVRKFAWSNNDWIEFSNRLFLSLIGLLFFFPLFALTLSIVWMPTFSIYWYRSPSCLMEGSFTKQLANGERYSLNYVRIHSDKVGLSCTSNFKGKSSEMKSYSFYKYGDTYTCDSNVVEDADSR